MPYVIGIVASAGVAVFARSVGFDRDRAFYPTVTIVVALYYVFLAVMPDPERGLREAVRVLKPGGRIAIFDKFLSDEEHPTLKRRLLNVLAKPLFSDLNRRLGPLMTGIRLVIERDEPVAFGGTYRVVTLTKPDE